VNFTYIFFEYYVNMYSYSVIIYSEINGIYYPQCIAVDAADANVLLFMDEAARDKHTVLHKPLQCLTPIQRAKRAATTHGNPA
jgi:hypothetical protein